MLVRNCVIPWIGQTIRAAFLPECQLLCLAPGRSLGVQLLNLKVWMMQEIRSGKKKVLQSQNRFELCYTALYWEDLVTGSISLLQPCLPWGLSLNLFCTAAFDCFTYLLSWPGPQLTFLCRALLAHSPVHVFKESEKQLLLLPALRHCQAAASLAVHLHCSNSGRISGSSGIFTISDLPN